MLSKQVRLHALHTAALAGVALSVLSLPALAQNAKPAMAPIPEGNFALTVTNERLLNAINEPQNWLTSNGNLESWRYSRLNQINRDNVGDLRMVWAMSLGGANDVVGNNGPNVMANPLVDNGMMYAVSEWGRVFKIDVRNPQRGDLLWVSDPAIDHEGNDSLTRGIALYGTNVYNALQDGRVVAINRDTGDIVWDKQVAVETEFGGRERLITQPIAAENKILVSNGAGDAGTRGWLAALDPATGDEIWRWYAVPEPGQPGSETWTDEAQTAWQKGGGGMWTAGSYDKTTRSAIWGTGNPVPIYDAEFRPGDNLYTDSTVSIDIDTGKLNWYFQYTPNDAWDYDENGVNMIQTLDVGGVKKPVVGHFGRNGFYYNLDLQTGKFINSSQYANEVTWTAGIDQETGKPVEYDPKLAVQTYIPATRMLRGDGNKVACPTWHGGIAMQPPAFNPDKQISYAVGTEGCFTQNGGTGVDDKNNMVGRTFTSDLYYGGLTAVDAANNQMLGKVVTDTEIRSGVLATAGGLVFTTLTSGDLVAYNDETLQELWRFNVGTPLKAPPMTFAVGPTQYVAFQTSGLHVHPRRFTDLMHSSYLFVFALGNQQPQAAVPIK
ncbi:pyrroloquinoline quinone-dependent dehydrogenase [Paradevosia shaoguanensis]|uniref:PQQ-binding-like beta-propeller repeat protein n=1 Tax=Paradevosia shaoguanensis TaxID=1335043 RepID=A0AA41UAT1_9HYPH|nr:PQQ-binding-like beta-propeller repeat protein [Paradevosia shaoguanensis]MCF1742187.1 PQQ-binding-like beta-propeller repeat protein [Paradevosia shaoguanensis]MCI0126670.1 PQQ-binding-like beta-propeller repeat protein [Paradevosia shaoguanensis]QMV02431.1 PQQ-binding-like beta-propeller repeat protein [Devosia sp. D6-9]CDP52059.1 Glucose dehydrogenase, PQQ-dependent [Devosia sp. DBB001]